MRQSLGPKKVARLRKALGLDIVGVHVRGGTHHRRDLLLADGRIVHLYSDGTCKQAAYGWTAAPPPSQPATMEE